MNGRWLHLFYRRSGGRAGFLESWRVQSGAVGRAVRVKGSERVTASHAAARAGNIRPRWSWRCLVISGATRYQTRFPHERVRGSVRQGAADHADKEIPAVGQRHGEFAGEGFLGRFGQLRKRAGFGQARDAAAERQRQRASSGSRLRPRPRELECQDHASRSQGNRQRPAQPERR